MTRIAVYGSLKKGKYNHPIIKDSEYAGDTKLRGTLYRVSSYPALVDEGDNEYPAELYDVEDSVLQYVRMMELGAGYKEKVVDGAIVYYAGDFLAERCRNNYEKIDSY